MVLIHRLRNWWGGSLRRRLLIASVITLLFSLVLLGYLSFRTGQEGVRREVDQRNYQLARYVARDINAQFDNIWGNVRLFTYQLEESAEMLALQAHAMLELRRASPLTYRALYLFDGEGHLLVHLAGPLEDLLIIRDVEEIISRPPISLTDEISTAYEAARGGDLFLSATYIVGAEQVPIVYMGAPIAVEQGRASQIIVAEIDLRDIWRQIDEIHVGQTGRAFVVSRGGTIIAHPDRAYIGQPLAPELRPVLAGYEGQAEYTDPISGARLLASYSPVGGKSGWSIVVEQERAESLASVNVIAFVSLGVLLVAIGMGTLVTVMTARSITYPIQHLAEATKAIAHTGNLSQRVAAEGQDEVGQLATTFNQMITSLRRAEEKARRRLDQQIAVNQLALALGETRDLNKIYYTIYQHIQALVDAWGFVVSSYDDKTQLIQAEYATYEGTPVDVTEFPTIPLAEPGQGTQSQVIRIGRPLYTPDHRKSREKGKTEYTVEKNGSISAGPPPEEEREVSTNSALYVPMRIGGQTIGVMQLQSPRLDAYTQEDIDLLAAMANVAAAAVQNARLYGAVQSELTERVRAEEALQEYSERLEEMVEQRTQELQDAQEQLIRKERLAVLGQLAGGVAHELRNPLGVISNAIYFLQMVLSETDETTREYLDIISSEVRGAEKIISGILDFSRTRLPEREEIAASDLVAQVLERRPPPEDVEVITEIPSDLPPVFVDPRQINQVLLNLVTNAYQAMPDGGRLIIAATVSSDLSPISNFQSPISNLQSLISISISITDTGCGIPQENLEKVFEPLFSTKAKGIGLGSAVSKNLVEANGGSIEVESEVGKGSTFTVKLPLARPGTRGKGTGSKGDGEQ
jgi:signal transduction histidine kinase/HAMP domain-containing protein